MSALRRIADAIATVASLTGLLFVSAALAQDNLVESTEAARLEPATRAAFLLDAYDLVAIGEFIDLPEDAAADLSPDALKEVVVEFRLHHVYQGYVSGDPISVTLPADMLRYPGENVSRYVKARDTLLRKAESLLSMEQELAALREALRIGSVTTDEFRRQENELSGSLEGLAADIAGTRNRMIAVIHGASFYDLGGALKQDEPYLLGLDRSGENADVFVLVESPHIQNVFWGQTRRDVVTALDRIMREE